MPSRMFPLRSLALAAAIVLCVSPVLVAQWLKYPTAGGLSIQVRSPGLNRSDAASERAGETNERSGSGEAVATNAFGGLRTSRARREILHLNLLSRAV